jgi:hypothetical protein
MKSKVLLTFYQEKYKPVIDIVHNRFEKYASKCDADFLMVLLPEDSTDPQMDKFFAVAEKLGTYEQYLVIDIDILIRNDAPSVFDIVGKNRVGIYNEGAAFADPEQEFIRWASVAGLIKLCSFEPVPYCKTTTEDSPFIYFNSGVVVFGEEHVNLYGGLNAEQKILCYKHSAEIPCSEQALLNYTILSSQYPVVSLPVCFNQMPFNRDSDYLDTAYFSHYAGISLEEKIESMQEDHKKWQNWGY